MLYICSEEAAARCKTLLSGKGNSACACECLCVYLCVRVQAENKRAYGHLFDAAKRVIVYGKRRCTAHRCGKYERGDAEAREGRPTWSFAGVDGCPGPVTGYPRLFLQLLVSHDLFYDSFRPSLFLKDFNVTNSHETYSAAHFSFLVSIPFLSRKGGLELAGTEYFFAISSPHPLVCCFYEASIHSAINSLHLNSSSQLVASIAWCHAQQFHSPIWLPAPTS